MDQSVATATAAALSHYLHITDSPVYVTISFHGVIWLPPPPPPPTTSSAAFIYRFVCRFFLRLFSDRLSSFFRSARFPWVHFYFIGLSFQVGLHTYRHTHARTHTQSYSRQCKIQFYSVELEVCACACVCLCERVDCWFFELKVFFGNMPLLFRGVYVNFLYGLPPLSLSHTHTRSHIERV